MKISIISATFAIPPTLRYYKVHKLSFQLLLLRFSYNLKINLYFAEHLCIFLGKIS